MTESQAWLAQVESDNMAAGVLYEQIKPDLYCQLIAKYQQMTEKSINAIDALLRETGVIRGRTRARHYPDRMIRRILGVAMERNQGHSGYLSVVFSSRWRPEIRDLCGLAPHLPAEGNVYERNTEYPYNLGSATEWTAPASSGSFSTEDVVRYHRIAMHMREGARRFADLVRLSRSIAG